MRNILKQATVEPSYFIFILISNWINDFDNNLILQKSCRHNSTIEPDLNTKCDDEKAGVLFLSEVFSKYRFAAVLVSTSVTMFGTTWSDKAGRRRRPLIYIPIFGQILVSMLGCLNSNFWHWTPVATAISSICFCLSGGTYLMVTACQMYLCDKSDVKNRTMKLGVVRAIRSICMILGKGSSGFILRRIGFFYSYLLCLILAIISLIFGILFIEDNSIQVEKNNHSYHIFNVKRTIFDNFKVVFDRNLVRKRLIVSLMIFAYVAVDFTAMGELSVLYPYLRYRFGLDEQKYSVFSFYKFSMSTLGILFCSVVLSKYLKVHDGLIGILAGSFDLVAIIALLFATQVWQIFVVPLIDLFHGCVVAVSISFMSKYYNANEIGRLNAVSSVFLLVVPLALPIYNSVFRATLDVFPTAFCLPSIVIDVAIIVCFWISYSVSKKIDTKKPEGVQEETLSMVADVRA